MNLEKKSEILYSHYNTSFDYQLKCIAKRNIYTIISIGLVAALFVFIENPIQIIEISEEVVRKQVGDVEISFSYIYTLLIFSFLWVVMLYFQNNLLIERNYTYIHKLEDELTTYLYPFVINRESGNYLKSYPIVLSLIHRIYTIFFPIIIISVSLFNWGIEYKKHNNSDYSGFYLLNSIILLFISIITTLYLMRIHFNDFRKSNKQI